MEQRMDHGTVTAVGPVETLPNDLRNTLELCTAGPDVATGATHKLLCLQVEQDAG